MNKSLIKFILLSMILVAVIVSVTYLLVVFLAFDPAEHPGLLNFKNVMYNYIEFYPR